MLNTEVSRQVHNCCPAGSVQEGKNISAKMTCYFLNFHSKFKVVLGSRTKNSTDATALCPHSRTTDTQWRHKSKNSENLGRCGRQNMLRPYLKIWDWDLIFGRAVKAISSPGVHSLWTTPSNTNIFVELYQIGS